MYAEEFKGSCPSHLQEPSGKTLNISFLSNPPYVIYNSLVGSDFLVIKILANKFRFNPKFIFSKYLVALDTDEASSSMVYQVKYTIN